METRRNGPQPRAHPGTTGLPGASEYPEHHALYGAGAGSVQGLLAGLTAVEGVTRVCRPVVDDSAVSSGRELQCLRLYREQE